MLLQGINSKTVSDTQNTHRICVHRAREEEKNKDREQPPMKWGGYKRLIYSTLDAIRLK